MRSFTGLLLLLLVPLAMTFPYEARAQLQGREWTPTIRMDWAPFDLLAVPRFEETENGMPVAYAIGGGQNVVGSTVRIRWTGAEWVSDWVYPFNCGLLFPVPSTAAGHTLMWKVNAYSPAEENKCDLVWADADQFGLISPDTLARVWPGLSEYAAAVTPVRRWAAASDYTNLRFWVKKGNLPKEEWEVPDQADQGLAIGALNDTTALVVWGSIDFGFRWAIAGEHWISEGPVPDTDQISERPRLRNRPSGGLWLAWGTNSQTIRIRSFEDKEWGPVHELDSSLGNGLRYRSDSVDLSRDSREWPAIAWTRVWEVTAGEEICVAIPDEAGQYSATVIPNSGGGILPSIFRDRYGDVWLGWFRFSDASYWTHSYTTANPLQPSLLRGARNVKLSCPLTTTAPGSHWTILRSTGDAIQDSVGVVVAGRDSILQWTDTDVVPSATYSYQVRRDCVDRRYMAFSPTAVASAPERLQFAVRINSSESQGDRISLSITGAAAGPVRIQLYDVAGRRMASGAVDNQGGPYEEQSTVLEVGHALRRGIYFARATDRTGATSEVARAVLLR